MAERSVNKAILLGRIGADAESRVTQNGTTVSRLSLAMNRQWTDSDQQVHEETDWIPVVKWNKEKLSDFCAMKSRFTEKQGQYLAFIYYYTKVNGQPPAEVDMRRYFRVTPPSVHQMVLTLE